MFLQYPNSVQKIGFLADFAKRNRTILGFAGLATRNKLKLMKFFLVASQTKLFSQVSRQFFQTYFVCSQCRKLEPLENISFKFICVPQFEKIHKWSLKNPKFRRKSQILPKSSKINKCWCLRQILHHIFSWS